MKPLAQLVVAAGLGDFDRVSEGGEPGICYYCKKDVDKDQIREVLYDAIVCPHCGIDAVMPKKIMLDVTPEIVNLLHDWGFQ